MDIAQFVQQMTPVFVTAPTARNGITLVQRLLNSSRQIIVYGENLNFIAALPRLVHSSVQVHNERRDEFAAARRQFLEQAADGWTSNLWPDPQPLMLAAFEAFYRAAVVYQQCSQQYGFMRWGIKNPVSEAAMIERLRVLMPRARFVFIHRHPVEVIKSARSRRFITSDEQLDDYARQWRDVTLGVLQQASPHVWRLKYEDLLADPDRAIDHLQQFAGVTNIDRSVMGRKFNTFAADAAGADRSGYIPPDALTDDEKHRILAITADAMKQLGYEAQPTSSATQS